MHISLAEVVEVENSHLQTILKRNEYLQDCPYTFPTHLDSDSGEEMDSLPERCMGQEIHHSQEGLAGDNLADLEFHRSWGFVPTGFVLEGFVLNRDHNPVHREVHQEVQRIVGEMVPGSGCLVDGPKMTEADSQWYSHST